MIILAWVLSAGIGAIVSGWNAYDAYLDLRALGSTRNGRRIIARGWVRRESIRFLIQLGWVAIAVPVLFRPDPEPSLILFVLVGTNLLLLISTILDARDRLRLRRILT